MTLASVKPSPGQSGMMTRRTPPSIRTPRGAGDGWEAGTQLVKTVEDAIAPNTKRFDSLFNSTNTPPDFRSA
ncbi:hypothetical protein GCM10010488_35710 [Oerskovia jenensis]